MGYTGVLSKFGAKTDLAGLVHDPARAQSILRNSDAVRVAVAAVPQNSEATGAGGSRPGAWRVGAGTLGWHAKIAAATRHLLRPAGIKPSE